MNTSYYDQLHQLLHTNPKLDIFNLYFLGICTEYTSVTTSLDWLLNQLPLNFPRLFEVFMGNKHEIGFMSRTLLRIIHNVPLEDRTASSQEIFSCERSEIEEDLKRILKDFELVRLLYPRVTKFQWFYLGIFMAKNRSFELLALLKGVYIDLLVRNYKYDEKGKVDFLASLLTEKYKAEESLAPSTREMRTGKIQAISGKLADLKRDLRSLVSLRNENIERGQKEEQENSSCITLRQTRKELPESIVPTRYSNNRRPIFKPRVDIENRDPSLKEELPRSKYSSFYPKDSLGFTRRPLQILNTNLGRMSKVEPLVVKCSPLLTEKIPPPLKIEPHVNLKENMTIVVDTRILPENKNEVRIPMIPKSIAVGECPICFDSVTITSNTRLKLCQHFFHTKCLQEYLQVRINEKNFPIVCAMDGCTSQILESQIIESLDADYREKFYSFSLKYFVETHNSEVFCCPTPNCEYFAFQEPLKKTFYCKKCAKAFCVKCRAEWHDGKTCEENKEEDLSEKRFYEYVSSKGCQQCPSCNYYIEKNEGCNHMTCRCGKEFCYSCLSDMNQCSCRNDNDY